MYSFVDSCQILSKAEKFQSVPFFGSFGFFFFEDLKVFMFVPNHPRYTAPVHTLTESVHLSHHMMSHPQLVVRSIVIVRADHRYTAIMTAERC